MRLRELVYRRYNVSFSKSGDDIQLMKLLDRSAASTYVDVGCWHPRSASNSYYFSLRGWHGLCIDPNPAWAKLYAKFRPHDTFVPCGVGRAESTLNYYMLSERNSSMNTLDLDFLRARGLEGDIQDVVEVPVLPLSEVLDRHLDRARRLDFFDVDVEGFDLEVLQSNDWERFRPKVIVVETDLPIHKDVTSDIQQYLGDVRYRLVAKSVMAGDLGNLFFFDDD